MVVATQWCQDCALLEGRQTPATKESDGDLVCLAHYTERNADEAHLIANEQHTSESKPERVEDCACGRPKGHRGRCRKQEKLARRESKRGVIEVPPEATTPPPPTPEELALCLNVHSITIPLRCGKGHVTLQLLGPLFDLTVQDRNFVFSLVDRLRDYENDLLGRSTVPRRDKKGRELFPVLLPLEYLEDMYQNCKGMDAEENAERAAMLAAWMRGDPAVEPLKAIERKDK